MPRNLLTLFLFFSTLSVSGQFSWSNPRPSGFINNKIVFTNSSNGYIINSNGDLIRTTDGGNKWSIYKTFPECRTMDVKDSFLVLGGRDTTIYISTDGAQTWSRGLMKNHSVIDKIQIINKDTIFALCKDQNLGTTQLFQSKDGGFTWQLINSKFIIKAVDFINSKFGYASGFGGVFKTLDGGITWDSLYKLPIGRNIEAVEFRDASVGFATQGMNRVIKTKNGGVSWDTCLTSLYASIHTISFANDSIVFLAGEYGGIYRSTDVGQNWQFKNNRTGDRDDVLSLHFTNSSTGFFTGFRGQIFKTVDTGNTYIDYSPAHEEIKPISFPTGAIGYIGSWNELFKTIDSGQTWSKLPFTPIQPQGRRFQYMHFFSKDTGIALLETPLELYKTDNGGLNWRLVSLPELYTENVLGFFVVGNTTYISVDAAYGYTIFKSSDHGETWQIQEKNYSVGYRNLFFNDEKTGYSASGPFVYKTTDSAKSWTRIFTNDIFTINTIWFTDPATGYFGSDEHNYKTTDSGRTWTPFAITPGNLNFKDVFAIRFFNKNVGYLTCADAGIYKTSNGGKSWRPEKEQPWNCRTILMTKDTTLFIGGDYGILLKKDMREYIIDSFRINQETSCSARIKADITAVLSTVDSIWVEYGTSAFTRSVLASSQVTDSTVKCDVAIQNISGDSNYVARIKILYRNQYYFSDIITFHTTALLKPVITRSGTLLSSSAPSGNQWYLNGVAIPGATNNTYQPSLAGIYTVQYSVNGCASAKSDDLTYTITATNDLLLEEGIMIFPNPVSTILWIKNKESKKLLITVMESSGRTVLTTQTTKTENTLNVQHLSAGIYILFIEDMRTHKRIGVKLLKQ